MFVSKIILDLSFESFQVLLIDEFIENSIYKIELIKIQFLIPKEKNNKNMHSKL